MSKSHAAVWPSGAPTPGQLKEFFAQIQDGKLTKDHMDVILRGEVQVTASFATNLLHHGFEVIAGKEGPLHPEGVAIDDFELKEFLFRDEKSISGEELVKRARQLEGFFGLHTAEYLVEHQDKIPKEWRGIYLVFPGTELRHSDGNRSVPFLEWYGGRWFLNFRWLGDRFDLNDRLLRPRA